VGAEAKSAIRQLEAEVRRLRRSLRCTSEEMESANEEFA
jgi:hypothetical protein